MINSLVILPSQETENQFHLQFKNGTQSEGYDDNKNKAQPY